MNGSRVEPFVHAGARYVDTPERLETAIVNRLPVTRITFGSRISAQAGGGLLVRLTQRTAVRAEVTRLLRSNDSRFDPLTRVAGGLSWHF